MMYDAFFASIASNIIGHNVVFTTPYGQKSLLYADWTASGRLYQPIEAKIAEVFGPYMGNTHTETTVTGSTMTAAYHEAKQIIKHHVGATEEDVLLFAGTGMTGALRKLQRMLGLTIHERFVQQVQLLEEDRPVVFISHMEHHSNQTSWLETICDVVIVPPSASGNICKESLQQLLHAYGNRKVKIGSFTACSNVTGVKTPYHQLAKLMHQHGGICFVDFSASAPYETITMHPLDWEERLDGIFFSPHKFLGGPGANGVLLFSKSLYGNNVPDQPGGGTVEWTDPWGGKKYITDVETREDGGTPGILQAIRTALAVRLKEHMNPSVMAVREKQLLDILLSRLAQLPDVHILEGTNLDRLPIVSIITPTIHYSLFVKLLNDVFGIQVRGGCACAGTYGHYLLSITPSLSAAIQAEIEKGNKWWKPGWVRIALHPTMTEEEVHFIVDAIDYLLQHIDYFQHDYSYDATTNEFYHHAETNQRVEEWFSLTEKG